MTPGTAADDPRGFLSGKSLQEELGAAMERIRVYGVTYPEGYESLLLRKYAETGVRYPHILMILGRPRIPGHFFYRSALSRGGRLLDYGCGTGDNVRQLIRDGFPRDRIAAYDVNRDSICLGTDLYRDGEETDGLFLVSETFPFGNGEFDTVYSGSVIHVIAEEPEFRSYLGNARTVLRPGGIFFGSTLGFRKEASRSPHRRGPPRIMTRVQLADSLTGAGFAEPEIERRDGVPKYVPGSEDLCVLEFCTRT